MLLVLHSIGCNHVYIYGVEERGRGELGSTLQGGHTLQNGSVTGAFSANSGTDPWAMPNYLSSSFIGYLCLITFIIPSILINLTCNLGTLLIFLTWLDNIR